MFRSIESLPDGYHFADPDGIEPAEVVALLRQVEIGHGIEDDHLQSRRSDLEADGWDVHDVGVRAALGRLVGFGSIAYGEGEGELCDFVVSPAHQGRGIGKAIIRQRLALADELGVTSLYLPDFEPTNTLRTFYLQNGFQEKESGTMVRSAVPLRHDDSFEFSGTDAGLYLASQVINTGSHSG